MKEKLMIGYFVKNLEQWQRSLLHAHNMDAKPA